jgi:acyl-CoA oxidase
MTYVEADNRYETVIYLVPGQGNDPAALLATIYYGETELQRDIDLILDEVDQVSSGYGFESVRPTLLCCRDEAPEVAPGVPQLATYAAGVVLNTLLARAGIGPDIIVPQSMGEIAGLVCAEVLDVVEGAHAVCALNIAFARHGGGGSMIVIRADADEAERVLSRAGRPDLVLAGANTARQSIISGSTESIDALMARASDPAVPTMLKMPVPYATHHPSLQPVADEFLSELRRLPQRPLRTAVHSPVRRRAYTDADDLHEALADCVVQPVYLMETLTRLGSAPGQLFIELGPGETLTRCVRTNIPGAITKTPLAKDGGWLHDVLQASRVGLM